MTDYSENEILEMLAGLTTLVERLTERVDAMEAKTELYLRLVGNLRRSDTRPSGKETPEKGVEPPPVVENPIRLRETPA